jgi:hypothetical protein
MSQLLKNAEGSLDIKRLQTQINMRGHQLNRQSMIVDRKK